MVMKKNVEEEKVKHILTDPKLSPVKAMLEKDHAIDCLFLLHLSRGKWKEAKDFMHLNTSRAPRSKPLWLFSSAR